MALTLKKISRTAPTSFTGNTNASTSKWISHHFGIWNQPCVTQENICWMNENRLNVAAAPHVGAD